MIIIIIMMMKCTCRTSCGARPAVAERRSRWMMMLKCCTLLITTINLGIKYTVQAEPQWLAWFYPAAAASSSSTSSSPEAENQSHPIHFAVLSLS
jgi:hypothetical protein